jgi:MoaA/NifB/PqqE/SkfB family radical SAM enzyme
MYDTNFEMEMFHNYENKIFWTISNFCNFKCPYCYIDKTQSPKYITQDYTPEYIADCFNKTGKTWLIMLAGGEPFIMPQFLHLMQELTKKHHIQISTNLCSDDVFKFPEYVSPERVMVINASLHVVEREKVDPKFNGFIEKCLFLQEKGFRVLVNYVAWPPLLTRIEKDFEYIKDKGIKNITAFTFLGDFERKSYPESYTEEQIRLISRLSMYKKEEDILRCKTNYKGIKCEAGHKYFTTELDGTVYKCRSIQSLMGNILDGTFITENKNKKCTADTCIDTYMAEFILDHSRCDLSSFFN